MNNTQTAKVIETTEHIFLNNEWVPLEQARIPVFDHGFLYGDGIYEGMRAYRRNVFMSDLHFQRLERSARCLDLKLPVSRQRLMDLIDEGLSLNQLSNAYIRLVVTRGLGPMGPDPAPCQHPQLILMVRDIPPLHGQKQDGIRVALSSVRRCGVDSATAQIKSLNYLVSILGKLNANRMDVDDVILLDSRGFVAEAPVANVFIVKDGIVLTPSSSSGILEGITRKVVIDLLSKVGLQVVERDLTPYDLSVAEEIFLTGTHAEIVPVCEYEGYPVGNGSLGPITLTLLDLFSVATGKGKES
jgi:branched-chain amino acid aminotransferase